MQGGNTMFLKRTILRSFAPLLLVALLAVACGTPASTSTGGSTATATTAPTAAATPPASPSSSITARASATGKGKSVTILPTARGRPLYYRTSDRAPSVSPGGCPRAGPPLPPTAPGKTAGAH